MRMNIPKQLERLASEMCDEYCKYPDQVHELYQKDKIEDDEYDYLMEHYCEKCPITRML